MCSLYVICSLSGQCIAKYETCLDCMWSKAMDLCRSQCLTGMHKLSVVVYPDDKTKHLLEVRRPINLKAMVDKQKRYTCWHIRDECKYENCQDPHNDIECAVWNKWRTECQSEYNAHEIVSHTLHSTHMCIILFVPIMCTTHSIY